MYEDALRPMLDKTMSGAFQPGSTFKAFSALAALENKVVDPDDHERCDGYVIFGRRIFHCAHVHGRVNMHEAIAESCNSLLLQAGHAAPACSTTSPASRASSGSARRPVWA